jgi:hypothetical protein
MAWIESHQELARHPKTKRLARILGCSVPAAIGHLHLLWWWATDYAADGDLSAFPPDELADALLWDRDPQALIDGLQQARFLDGLQIHDWDDYAGRLAERRFANAQRMRRARSDAAPSITESGAMNVPARVAHVPSGGETRAGLHTEQTVPTGQTQQTEPDKHIERTRRAPAAAPPELAKFDAILRELPGYRPTKPFYDKIASRYAPVMDCESEAIKIADWVTRKRTQCTTARVFNWLDNAIQAPPSRRNGSHFPKAEHGHVSERASKFVGAGSGFTGATP